MGGVATIEQLTHPFAEVFLSPRPCSSRVSVLRAADFPVCLCRRFDQCQWGHKKRIARSGREGLCCRKRNVILPSARVSPSPPRTTRERVSKQQFWFLWDRERERESSCAQPRHCAPHVRYLTTAVGGRNATKPIHRGNGGAWSGIRPWSARAKCSVCLNTTLQF